jgi:hypothetical protein
MRIRATRYGNCKREQGSVMIEATLTLMLFLVILFSIFDFGFSLFLHQTFVHQARTGARYGAVNNPNDVVAIKNMVLHNQTTGSGNGFMGLSPDAVQVTRLGTPGRPDDRIVVTISGYTFVTIAPGWAGRHTGEPITVSMRVEN